jgi:putative selenate reductase
MKDATPVVDRLRAEIPPAFRAFRDLDFPTQLTRSVTLSTFHGCPPDEIERIIDHLLHVHELHCVVKFNPTLLGRFETRRLLHGELDYGHIRVPPQAFERDTRWDDAAGFMERLGNTAGRLGLQVGAKFSNTLIVENVSQVLPLTEKEVYLSGPPLHVLALQLTRRFRRHFGDRFPISFAAGVTRANFPDTVALGLVPVTVCTDLLKTGGYGRLPAFHRDLARRMADVGATTIGDFIVRAYGKGGEALDKLKLKARDPVRVACRKALEEGGDLKRAAGSDELYRRWVSAASLLNTEHYVPQAIANPRYARARNRRPPRKVGSRLELFDCLTCDKCIPVCPNDAVFSWKPLATELPVERVRPADGENAWHWEREKTRVLTAKHQIGIFADFCNECGNCDVFCPEEGGPHLEKPRFYGSEADWRRFAPEDGFYLEPARLLGRIQGREYRLERRGDRVTFAGHGFTLRFAPDDPENTLEGEAEQRVDLMPYHVMKLLFEALLGPRAVNYMNCLHETTPERHEHAK